MPEILSSELDLNIPKVNNSIHNANVESFNHHIAIGEGAYNTDLKLICIGSFVELYEFCSKFEKIENKLNQKYIIIGKPVDEELNILNVRRDIHDVLERRCIVVDIDGCNGGCEDVKRAVFDCLGNVIHFIVSTHSYEKNQDSPKNNRFRLFIETDRVINRQEHEKIVVAVCRKLNKHNLFDGFKIDEASSKQIYKNWFIQGYKKDFDHVCNFQEDSIKLNTNQYILESQIYDLQERRSSNTKKKNQNIQQLSEEEVKRIVDDLGLVEILDRIPVDKLYRDEWLTVGWSIANELSNHEYGLNIYKEWSNTSKNIHHYGGKIKNDNTIRDTYYQNELERKKSNVGIGTLRHLANKYSPPKPSFIDHNIKKNDFNLDILPYELKEAVLAVQKLTSSDVKMCVTDVLACVCVATQGIGKIYYDVWDKEIPLSQFFIVLSKTGGRKTATLEKVQRPFHKRQKELKEIYKDKKSCYDKNVLEIQKHNKKVVNQDKNIECKIPLIKPSFYKIIFSNFTSEGINKYLLQNGYPSIWCVDSEAGSFFGGHSMKRENVINSIASYNKHWDGDPITITRASYEECDVCYDRLVSFLLKVQPKIAKEALRDELLQAQGFWSRFLIVNTSAGDFDNDLTIEEAKKRVENFNDKIYNLLNLTSIEEKTGGLKLKTILVGDEAKRKFKEVCLSYLNKKVSDKYINEATEGFLKKAPEIILRLAGSFQLLESNYISNEEIYVKEENIMRAFDIIKFFIKENECIYGFSLEQEYNLARKTIEWLHETKKGKSFKEINVTDLITFSSFIQNAEMARKVIEILYEYNWLLHKENYQKKKNPNYIVNRREDYKNILDIK